MISLWRHLKRAVLNRLRWFLRLLLSSHRPVIYDYHHPSFLYDEDCVLSQLLPLWNKKVWPKFDAVRDICDEYGVRVKPCPRVRGFGLFNGSRWVMPPQTTFAIYCGRLFKDSDNDDEVPTFKKSIKSRRQMLNSTYCQDMRLWFLDHDTATNVEGFVDGHPKILGAQMDGAASRLNHSCQPNAKSVMTKVRVDAKGNSLGLFLVSFVTLRAIAPAEELTIHYGPGIVASSELEIVPEAYYAACRCGADGDCPLGSNLRVY